MDRLIAKYADKIVAAGLADPGAPLIAGLDDELVWNREDARRDDLGRVFDELNISSLLVCRPVEPVARAIDYLARRAVDGAIHPRDAETRTFLHDLPVAPEASAAAIVAALSRRRSVILPGGAIATFGTVSPEQAFIAFSSVCFACFVKFHADLLTARRAGLLPDPATRRLFLDLWEHGERGRREPPRLRRGPLRGEAAVQAAMIEAGRLTVELNLVDSFFGNVSFLDEGVLHISQTGSSLDELEGCIDPCPLDGSSSAGVTASSELVAHRRIVTTTPHRAVLHGHPRFAVIISLDCQEKDCPPGRECHTRCDRPRHFEDVPIIPGEVGTGPFGLCHTLPAAIADRRAAIVYGHGLFTVGREDFALPFANMLDIETACRRACRERLGL